MEFRPHNKPYKFFPSYERVEPLILDHTAMIVAKQCLRKYFFQIVLGSVSRGVQPPYFSFGSAYHKFREVLELEWMKDANAHKLSAVDKEAFQKSCFVKAVQAAIIYFQKATGGKTPLPDDKWSFLTQERLIQSCGVAFKVWQTEKAQGKIIVLAVEQPFNVETNETGEYTSGRFDQIVRWNGKIYGRDWKTSSKDGMYYQRGLDPNDQFTRYTYAEQKLAGERVQGQMIEVLMNNKSKGPIITNYLATRTQWQLDDWEQDEKFHRDTLRRARELDIWPKSEVSCTFCPFHSVCKMGSMDSQQAKLKSEFTQRAWDNMTIHLLDE